MACYGSHNSRAKRKRHFDGCKFTTLVRDTHKKIWTVCECVWLWLLLCSINIEKMEIFIAAQHKTHTILLSMPRVPSVYIHLKAKTHVDLLCVCVWFFLCRAAVATKHNKHNHNSKNINTAKNQQQLDGENAVMFGTHFVLLISDYHNNNNNHAPQKNVANIWSIMCVIWLNVLFVCLLAVCFFFMLLVRCGAYGHGKCLSCINCIRPIHRQLARIIASLC